MRYVVVIAGLLLVIGALVGVKACQISSLIAMGEAAQQAGPPPEAVGTAVAQAQSWASQLDAVGTVTHLRSVAVSNEAAGIVERIRFQSGKVARRGQILVELDASVERAELASARARLELAETTLARTRTLIARRLVAPAQLDTDEAAVATAKTEVEALEAQIERKIVRAPFDGRLGIRNVDLGQYLQPGTTVTVLDSLGAAVVDFALPQGRLGSVAVDQPVRIVVAGAGGPELQGKITVVEPTVDGSTRSLALRASVDDPKDRLRAGMFVNVTVVTSESRRVVAVPATAVVHAPYGDSVFVVEEKAPGSPGMDRTPDGKPVKIARQQLVRLGAERGDYVAVAQGLAAGQEVVSAGAFKLRPGAPVVIDNSIQPKPELEPRPENR